MEGVYLYYGYKVKAFDLRGLYEEAFKALQIEQNSKVYSQKGKEYKYKLDPSSFGEYVSNIFAKLGAKDIVATTLPCCNYEKDGYWIIGKHIAHINGFNLKPVMLPILDDSKLIYNVLAKLVADSDLSKIITSDMVTEVYAIGDDCTLCS